MGGERGRRSAPPVSSTATSTPPEPRRRPCAGPPPVGTWVPPRHTGPAGVPFTSADFVGEGGAVEQDGAGTLMATRSSLLNRNRNPGMSEQTLTAEMCEAYGASKVIWFDGVYGQDITDDHVDATSRFLAPGEALVQMPLATDNDAYAKDARQQHRILTGSTTAGGVRWT
ncbi:agmatine deiminase family protein [Streptomyces anulatus]